MKSTTMSGIFNWPRGERVSDRYGLVGVHDANYEGSAKVDVVLDSTALKAMKGKRARIAVLVVETRDSGHIGDLFRGLVPSRPEPGDVYDLGTGTLFLHSVEGVLYLGLAPDDGRLSDWFDPNKLYRLHDQTVQIVITLEG